MPNSNQTVFHKSRTIFDCTLKTRVLRKSIFIDISNMADRKVDNFRIKLKKRLNRVFLDFQSESLNISLIMVQKPSQVIFE